MNLKPNILIVEDEILIARHIKQCLEKENIATAVIAKSYNEALGFLESNHTFDIVFLDVNISGSKTGIDLAKYINANHGIPFLYLTSYTDTKTLSELQATYPEAYISKPFNNADIIATITILTNKLKLSKLFKLQIGKVVYNINLEQLLYAKSDHVYVDLVLKNETLIIRSTIASLLEKLPKGSLVQINRSVAVNPMHIINSTGKVVTMENIAFNKSPNYSL